MKKVWVVFILLFSLLINLEGQIVEEFNYSNFNQNLIWQGDTNKFVCLGGELRSNENTANTSFGISTFQNIAVNTIWQLDIKLKFNTSSLNYVDFVLLTDSSNFLQCKNGYFVRIGGTTDEVSLYKIRNGTTTKLIDGTDGIFNTSNNEWRIIVEQLNKDSFRLYRQTLDNQNTYLEGIVKDTLPLSSGYVGIWIKQSTASFFNKHFFDNFIIQPITEDTLPPKVDSIKIVGNNTLNIFLNEPCDSILMMDTAIYKLLNSANVAKRVQITNMGRGISVEFENSFLKNKLDTLQISKIADKIGNMEYNLLAPFFYLLADTPTYRQVLITEILADPDPVVGLDNREYIELSNLTDKYLTLEGCTLSDFTTTISLPKLILTPYAITALYQVPTLNNSGDNLVLKNANGKVVHQVTYTDKWYNSTVKRQGGWSLEMKDTGYLCQNEINWAESIDASGGTPGRINSIATRLINSTPLKIENSVAINDTTLLIVFNTPIDSAFLIAASLVLDINDTIKIQQSIGKHTYWKLPKNLLKDRVYTAQILNLTDCYRYSFSGVISFQIPQIPNRNDIVINEILFNPRVGGKDFIELYNNSNKVFLLNDLFVAALDDRGQYKSIDRISLQPIMIKPFTYLFISEDTTQICYDYNCKNNSALKVQSNKIPTMPDDKGNILLINIKGSVVDSVVYASDWHNPLLSNVDGVSLERISFTGTSHNKNNWYSAASTAGYATPGYLNSQANEGIASINRNFELKENIISPDDDGYQDLLFIEYQLPQSQYAVNIDIYTLQGILIKNLANNETLARQGVITWDGTDNKQQKAPIGIYLIKIKAFNANGEIIEQKLSCTVAGKF